MIKLQYLRAAKFKQLDDVALAFPARGSLLVQGLNEAGKSTLFESVFFALFGKGLVTEDNAGKLDDLINYQSPRALVKLAFSTDDATFNISRSLNRGKPNTAVLDIDYAGGKHETVTNLTAVNKRIVEELRLDADALLNSCFVEQKKLEKLEGMNAQQRRDTLLRLLNLDKLSLLEAQYKPSSSDEFQLDQLRGRVRLAEVQRELPAALDRTAAVEREFAVVKAIRLGDEIAQLEASVEAERKEQERLKSAGEELMTKLREVEQLKELRDLARSAGEGLQSQAQEQADVAQLQADMAAHQEKAGRLPELEAHVRSLEDAAAELAAHARATREAELLRSWLQIREVALIAQQGEQQLNRLKQEALALEQSAADKAARRDSSRRQFLVLAVAAVLALAAGFGLGATIARPALALIAVAIALAGLCFRARRQLNAAMAELLGADTAVTAARTAVNRQEGEQELARRTGQDPERLLEVEQELVTVGSAVPASVEAAHAKIAGLEREPKPAGTAEARTEAEARELAAAARSARQQAIDAAAKATELEQTLTSRNARIAERKIELDSTLSRLATLHPERPSDVEACRALWRTTGDALAALDEAGVRREAEAIVQQLGASTERAGAAAKRIEALERELTALDLASAELAKRRAELSGTQLAQLEAALQQEQRDLLGRVASLRDQQSALEQQLGLQGVEVDRDEALRELATVQERNAVRKQAHRILTLARKNIVDKVLPSTIRNMGLLLPLLTNDRYRDVDIDSDSYKIKVWDETARAMKAKDIFSGGTRDQFSLALRLAFALATLPEELGTVPGFIFLDEPLSSFDSQRGSALVDLLTRGPIADNFEQIFVISHNRSFDESLFDFHLRLDAGRIVDSDLPVLPDGEQSEAQQLELAAANV